ncbi:MAG: hypothetical protein HS105_10590 [Chloracidobacterium sp.]|nr:hypothetical protein [Chloracidobacterium sp.]MCO5333704.1 hypothetical protein [Pyrinomonadaceae bacterium]
MLKITSGRLRAVIFGAMIAMFAVSMFVVKYNSAEAQSERISDRAGLAPHAATVSGRVFLDFNMNGEYDTSGGTAAQPTSVDIGVQGVTVTAYDPAGTSRGTATSAANGTYSIAVTGTGPYRIEFTNLPADLKPSARSASSVNANSATTAGSTVHFVPNANTSDVNLALHRPSDYCQNNPTMCSQLYGMGNTNTPGAAFTFPFWAGSTRTGTENGSFPGAFSDFLSPTGTSLATLDEIGTTFGIAYHRTSRRIFTAAYMKKHSNFGLAGTGAIYQIDRNTGFVTTFVDLNSVFGANTAGANPHNTNNYLTDNGNTTWDAVGKVAFGGIALNEDESYLYAMNLADRRLYKIPTSGPLNNTTITRYAFPTSMPNCNNAADVRPFAVSWYAGKIYVGAVCSRETASGSTSTNLRGYVYTFDPTTNTFAGSATLNFQLNYTRQETDPGYSANWRNWRTTYQTISTLHFIYPQPMLTDIDFDRGNMILALRDRDGDQTGYNIPSDPSQPNDYSKKGITAGDILRACGDPTNGWTLESNARCGGIGNGPTGSNEGPGGGEYYYQENYHPNGTPHDEVGLGAVAQIPGQNVMIASIFDPIYLAGTNVYDAQGFRWFVNGTGAQNRGYQVNDGDFGKANGIGNVVALCDAAPLEIGNRVWLDTNGNGVQDPGENGIAGVQVRLYLGSTLVGTAVTDANGEYYFVSSTSVDANTNDNIGQVNGGIQFDTAYQIRFDRPADYANGGPLKSLLLTRVDQTSQLGDKDASDSDAVTVSNPPGSPAGNFPVINVTTGGPGSNDHTYDAGFYLLPSAGGVNVSGRITLRSGSGVRNVVVALIEADGTQHVTRTGSFGYYQFDDIPAGQTAVIAVSAKSYTFIPMTRMVSLDNDLFDVDWVAEQ